jgi:hypothetical protein
MLLPLPLLLLLPQCVAGGRRGGRVKRLLPEAAPLLLLLPLLPPRARAGTAVSSRCEVPAHAAAALRLRLACDGLELFIGHVLHVAVLVPNKASEWPHEGPYDGGKGKAERKAGTRARVCAPHADKALMIDDPHHV